MLNTGKLSIAKKIIQYIYKLLWFSFALCKDFLFREKIPLQSMLIKECLYENKLITNKAFLNCGLYSMHFLLSRGNLKNFANNRSKFMINQ